MRRRLLPDEALKRSRGLRKKRGLSHTFKLLNYKNVRKLSIEAICLQHNRFEIGRYLQYTSAKYGTICCSRAAVQRTGTSLNGKRDRRKRFGS